ncbi:Leucine-rich repeat domain, L domain-like [Phytophthora cactorum]|nr:Leucine-rich repeat domain, L domain-like [Phytophthora cactorum]
MSTITNVTKFSFDLAAAVLFPILTLLYCYYNFDFDRQAYLFYLEILPAGSFEHNARSLADPSEMALFRVIFDSLRINSPLDFAIRISMNLALCYRFERVLESLIWSRYREYASRGFKKTVPNTTTPVQQNAVPKGVVSVYVAAILAILLSTHKAITDSETLCSSHPECVVYAHRWQTSDEHCPCVILIDVDLAPKMYNQWMDPVNAYDTVKTLAGAGMLTSLQVINRQLVEWPEELRRCSGLKTIQLIYTDVEHIPAWAKDFHNLVTIQIEGRYGSTNLVALPEDLFSDLPRLSMIHLGIHVNLQAIPAFTGVPNLQSLTLAWTNQLRQLPSFEHSTRSDAAAKTRADTRSVPLEKLVEFVVFRPNRVCCNGFMGPCNLTHGSCQANSLFGTSPATCLMNDQNPKLSVDPFLRSSATAKAFETFSAFICQENLFDKLELSLFPTKETITMCQGKPYRQCQFPGNISGICYNTRFQVLSCVPDDNYIALRRLEITKGIGPVCDPAVEKWLGCTM